jgi:hypothetical protein
MPKLQQCKEDLGEKMTWKSSTASKVIGKTYTHVILLESFLC